MGQLAKRHIGRILLDGSFLSQHDLDSALEEQKRTKKLLGQILIRMGVLKGVEIRVPLLVQKHLGTIENAVKVAAGERQLLGELLVHSGHITNKQLDYAISEQLKSGEKLGEIFMRLGMLNERQLNGLIDFQMSQDVAHDSPLRLGELLIATGHITREQLEDALHRQGFSKKKLGEILLETGYVAPDRIKYGIRLQKMLLKAVLASILALGMSTESDASSVQLQWDQNTESDLAGYKVYSGDASATFTGTTPVDVQKQTTATISGLDPGKAYTFAVTAYNSAGVESTYSNIVSVAEQTPPAVAITSPADSVSVSGVVSMNVNASDNVGVTKVEFYVNGVLKATDIGAPYVYSWDTSSLPTGIYTLMAKAYDAAGNASQSSRSVTVVNDLIAPTVALTTPANNTSVTGTVTISSSASDNVGVTKVEFYCNGVLLYATNTPPYNFSWNTKGVADGGYVLTAKAYDNAGNYAQSSAVTVAVSNPVPDLTAPIVSSFTLPAASSSLTVPVSGLSASDAFGVTGYLITESATPPAASAAGWSATAPSSFTFSGEGTKTAYAWAKDAAGNVSSSRTASVTITLPDITAPLVGSFTLPATSTSLTVPVTGLSASDAFGVTGYLITESATPPAASAAGWSATAPSSFTFSGEGTKTAYAWAKDAAGNVSSSRTASVTITLPDISAPLVGSFTLPATSTSLTVPVTGLSASDAFGVTGYLITESATPPAASAAGWSATAPSSFTFSGEGTKTAYAWAKDAAGNVSSSRTASVTITLPDISAPLVGSFTLPATSTSLTVPVTGLSASDAFGVTGYLITESATPPAASAAGWSATAPSSFTFSGEGTKTAYAWAKDAAGNVSSSRTASVTITLPDISAPLVGSFTLPATSTSLTVPVTGLSASDAFGVTGYLITESATPPAASAAGWSATAPSSFTFSGEGTKTAYAWAKDAAGNVSSSRTASVTITLPDISAPLVGSFTLPATSTSLTVPVTGLSASDAFGVTGYLITESATPPAASAAGWSATAPSSFTFSGEGTKTAYAWAKDAAGNVSSSRTASVTITLPDITAPLVGSFTLPATSTSLTVPVTGLSASDAFGVTGYLITESATPPAASAVGWSASAPSSFTFSGEGTKTAYAWAKDAAGNVSSSRTASVTITLPDITAPLVGSFTLPATSTSLTVPVTGLSASDAFGVTGYLITESATPPAASTAGWSATAPSIFTFSGEGTKTAYAWAKDAAGNVSSSRTASVTITLPDITAPIVSIPSPISGAIVKGIITVTAGATDNIGVTRVEFYVNGNLQASNSSAPYSFSWNTASLANGAYNLTAKAYDAAGNISQSSSVNVTVNNPIADVTPPTISFSSPSSKYVYGSSISISASAADNVAVTKMELYVDGALQLTTSASSINTKVNIAKGIHIIVVKAYDAANNVNSSSKTVNRFF